MADCDNQVVEVQRQMQKLADKLDQEAFDLLMYFEPSDESYAWLDGVHCATEALRRWHND